VINPTQRTLPDKTQHLQEKNTHTPVGFEATIPGCEWPQTYGLEHMATGIRSLTH